MARRVISGLRERLRSTRYLLRSAAGARGKLAVARFLVLNRVSGASEERRSLVGVPMKALDGRRIWVRARSSDIYSAGSYYEHGLHLPPPGVRDEDLRLICELGTNIGAALAALAVRYPNARLIGVEPDASNLALARRNVEAADRRVTLVHAGVWDSDVTLVAEDSRGEDEHGLTTRALAADEEVPPNAVRALTVDSLLERHAAGVEIDYMHVSVEGAEPRIFAAGGEWPRSVRSLRVELHPYFGFDAERCVRQLQALGYESWAAPEAPEKWVYAVREPATSPQSAR